MLPRTRREWLLVLVLLLTALVLRAGVVMATEDTYVNRNDAIQFDLIATSIANGDGYGETVVYFAEGPSALRGPVYPVLLAGIYTIFGDHSTTVARLANAAIGVVVVGLIGLLASMLLGRRVGVVALAIAAVHPTLILFTSAVMLDALLAALILGALAAALQHRRAPRGLRWPIAAGLLIGIGLLTRETAGFAAIPVAGLLWMPRGRATGRPWAPVVVAGAVAAVTMLPWVVRNAVELDAFVPGTTTTGYGLAGTYNDTSRSEPEYPAIWIPPERDPEMAEVIAGIDPVTEVALDRELSDAAIDYIVENPEYVPRAMFWNTVRLYDLQGPEHAVFYAPLVPYSVPLTRVSVYASYLMYVLTAVGIGVRALRGTPWAFWLYPVIATIGFAFVSGTIRYRSTIEPFLVIAAAATLVWVFDQVSRRRSAPAP